MDGGTQPHATYVGTLLSLMMTVAWPDEGRHVNEWMEGASSI